MGCDDQRVEAARQSAVELVGVGALVVDRDRHRPKVQRLQQVEQSREGGILDPDAIAGPEVRLQDAFEPVEGAADEAQRRRVDAGAPELGPGMRDERVQLGVLLVAGDVGATRGDALERRPTSGTSTGSTTPDARSRMPAGSRLTRDGRGSSCAATRVPRRPSLMTKPRSRSRR